MSAQTFDALPPISARTELPANPLKGVLVTVFALKIVVAAFLVGTVSLAPPVNTDQSYLSIASVN